MRWLVVLSLACVGQLEYEPGAYRQAAASPPVVEPPPTPPPETPPPEQPPPMTAPPTMPPASACAEGMDALVLFTSRCGACHDAKQKAKGLDLVSPGVGARVVGVKSMCGDKLLLDPAAAAPAGHLLDKLRGPVEGCGQQMPYGGTLFSEQELACVLEWSERAIATARGGS